MATRLLGVRLREREVGSRSSVGDVAEVAGKSGNGAAIFNSLAGMRLAFWWAFAGEMTQSMHIRGRQGADWSASTAWSDGLGIFPRQDSES